MVLEYIVSVSVSVDFSFSKGVLLLQESVYASMAGVSVYVSNGRVCKAPARM